MKNFFDRITEITNNEGINITTLEHKIGASQGVLSRAKRNNTSISVEWIMKILENYPKYNANWLLKGRGEMIENRGGADESEVTFLREKNILLQKNSQLLEEKVERLEEELTALKKRILFTEETKNKIA